MTGHRHIALERGSNFRDLGGYRTGYGRRVRWGQLFRAGELTKLSDADIGVLDALGLKLVYDLRTSSERNARPSRSWGEVRRLHRDYRHSGADLTSMLASTEIDADHLTESMLDLYRSLPFDHAESFRTLLLELAKGEFPLLFHCAGGKDRTGVFAALLLALLGVSREDILADYLLSNDGLDAARGRFLAHVGRDDIDPSIWDPMLIVDREYLDAMFAAIGERHGGVSTYFDWLGIGTETIQKIRNLLLEPNDG